MDDPVYEDQLDELIARIQFCVDYMQVKGLLDEGCFTFPDGMTVWATGKASNEKT